MNPFQAHEPVDFFKSFAEYQQTKEQSNSSFSSRRVSRKQDFRRRMTFRSSPWNESKKQGIEKNYNNRKTPTVSKNDSKERD